MNQLIDMLFGKELEFYVRKEFERMVGRDNADVHLKPPTMQSKEDKG
jgi:hypothetical protein